MGFCFSAAWLVVSLLLAAPRASAPPLGGRPGARARAAAAIPMAMPSWGRKLRPAAASVAVGSAAVRAGGVSAALAAQQGGALQAAAAAAAAHGGEDSHTHASESVPGAPLSPHRDAFEANAQAAGKRLSKTMCCRAVPCAPASTRRSEQMHDAG